MENEIKDELIKDVLKWGAPHRYRLLGRLQHDCNVWLGYGFGAKIDSHLWAMEPQMQIDYMRALWESFPDDAKPEWCTMEQINDYAARMGVE